MFVCDIVSLQTLTHRKEDSPKLFFPAPSSSTHLVTVPCRWSRLYFAIVIVIWMVQSNFQAKSSKIIRCDGLYALFIHTSMCTYVCNIDMQMNRRPTIIQSNTLYVISTKAKMTTPKHRVLAIMAAIVLVAKIMMRGMKGLIRVQQATYSQKGCYARNTTGGSSIS